MLSTFLFWRFLHSQSVTSAAAEFSIRHINDFIAAFIVLVLLLILFVLPGAYVIRSWSDEYFGGKGVVRWTIFGVLCGCLAQVRFLVPENTLENGLFSFLIEKSISVGSGFIILCAAHFLVFKLFKGKTS